MLNGITYVLTPAPTFQTPRNSNVNSSLYLENDPAPSSTFHPKGELCVIKDIPLYLVCDLERVGVGACVEARFSHHSALLPSHEHSLPARGFFPARVHEIKQLLLRVFWSWMLPKFVGQVQPDTGRDTGIQAYKHDVVILVMWHPQVLHGEPPHPPTSQGTGRRTKNEERKNVPVVVGHTKGSDFNHNLSSPIRSPSLATRRPGRL